MPETTSATTRTGGCQCGAVRYAITGTIDECNVCHCRMCQKASGGPFMAFVSVPAEAVSWTHGARARFRSSTLAERGFCRDCGTPLTYERTPQRISISHGSLDDPRRVDPTLQLVGDALLPWSGHVADLPVEDLKDWLASLGTTVTNHQHPDHET